MTREGPDETEASPAEETDLSPPPGSFGDAAAEMANETEVEGASDEPEGADDELTLAQIALAERTTDLQRLQAEYLNYKRRVERDRELIRENATYAVLTPIIDVLDNIDRARDHGPLDDGFKAVAEQLERVVGGLGLTKFGEPGDPFDPTHARRALARRRGRRGVGPDGQGGREGRLQDRRPGGPRGAGAGGRPAGVDRDDMWRGGERAWLTTTVPAAFATTG